MATSRSHGECRRRGVASQTGAARAMRRPRTSRRARDLGVKERLHRCVEGKLWQHSPVQSRRQGWRKHGLAAKLGKLLGGYVEAQRLPGADLGHAEHQVRGSASVCCRVKSHCGQFFTRPLITPKHSSTPQSPYSFSQAARLRASISFFLTSHFSINSARRHSSGHPHSR